MHLKLHTQMHFQSDVPTYTHARERDGQVSLYTFYRVLAQCQILYLLDVLSSQDSSLRDIGQPSHGAPEETEAQEDWESGAQI